MRKTPGRNELIFVSERTYHGLVLDRFQEEALDAIDEGQSVIVAAPTGTGKTLVADYLVEKVMAEGRRIIYTAPIKALSNQKFKDYKQLFGVDQVGILTGDVVLNSEAPLLIMTTEIFRNQVITGDPALESVSYIIFDEIHWLNDEERGTVWEESIILAPPHMKLLGLSATVANARQLVDWIGSIRQEEVALIQENHRIVPLEYYYFAKDTGLVNYEKLWKYYRQRIQSAQPTEGSIFAPTHHLDLIKVIQKQYLPALYFVFSRKQCADKASELAYLTNYLNPQEKRQVEDAFLEHFGPESDWYPSTRLLRRLAVKGIAFHHAGLMPSQKVLVEELFLKRLIHVLYCTETFSVGINYPVRSVCFDTLNKFDGRNFRPLANHEFFQMSGRAGRRGLDERGYSFALVDLNYMEKSPPPRFNINRLEPLTSQFKLSYNTVLNLQATLSYEQIQIYFQKSFAAHSNLQTHGQLIAELAQLEEQFNEKGEHVCRHTDSFACPVKYLPKKKELDRLKRSYQALGPRRQNRVYGREMARKIKNWEKLLATTPQKCPNPKLALCEEESKQRRKLQQRMIEIRKDLKTLPDQNFFFNEFQFKKNQLTQMGYIREDELLPRGECARHIYVQELLVTELIFSGLLETMDDDQLNALLSAIDFEARKNDYFQRLPVLDWTPLQDLARYIQSVCGPESVRYDPRVAVIVYSWSQGVSFAEVQRLSNLDEGDIISVIRRTIDLLRQMRDAVKEPALLQRLKLCMDKLDRDEAAVLAL
ncbi:DEAD/DEAH box helicase [Desulfitobacterium hafniense]|uniref:DEAD/DEAH box helicase n=1 Tax=Desulfitobacterium hafniense TaxID=49338 RepID=UPI00035D11F8|nr:DEAD/DEAH box helicase [Desulfitobacterium hafniense]